jgi:mono/diheme cytochrome c family protein
VRASIIAAVVVIVLIIGGSVGWLILRTHGPMSFAGGTPVDLSQYHGPDPTGVTAALAQADPVKRGEYLVRAGDCLTCHTAPDGKAFAGGYAFKLPFGTIYSANITPDTQTGIGNWSDADFLRAMHDGIAKNGEYLYPAFPYPYYTLLTDNDVLAIKTYLFSLKPVHSQPPPDDLKFPFNQRYLLRFWNILFNPDRRFQPNSGRPPQWNRGAYLTEALGHCDDCHTPTNFAMAPDENQKFGGSLIDGWKAYNISADRERGVGSWTVEQLGAYLADGHAPERSSASGPMSSAVGYSLRFLTTGDIQAMEAYIKSVPAIADSDNPAAVPWPASPPKAPLALVIGGSPGAGQRVFEGACASCHGFDGKGTIWQHADLVGDRSVYDPAATNVILSVLQGVNLSTVQGQVFMPAFGSAYSDNEIADVANYVTSRFGGVSSNVTAADVAKLRHPD